MNIYYLHTLLSAGLTDPFADIRRSLASLLSILLALVAMISLVAVVIHIIQGERDAAKKASVWLIVTALGFAFIEIIGQMSFIS